MADKILLRRGNKADIPVLASGEPGIALDEGRLYFGTSSGNVGLPKKEQEAWIAPTLLNGWVNSGGLAVPAGYYKDDFGIVHVRGTVKSGNTAQFTNIFILPIGYRTSGVLNPIVNSNGAAGHIYVYPGGEVQVGVASNVSLFFGFSFRAEIQGG